MNNYGKDEYFMDFVITHFISWKYLFITKSDNIKLKLILEQEVLRNYLFFMRQSSLHDIIRQLHLLSSLVNFLHDLSVLTCNHLV